MKELVRTLVLPLVNQPEEVSIEEKINDGVVTVEIRVAQEDMGRVIGKGGRVINAIRTLTKASATRENIKVFVEVI